MKFMIRTIVVFAILFLSLTISAQSAFEALRYSSFEYSGTARSVGTAGVLGAFGGDFSVVSTNPAGLAAYRSSEFVVTPGLYLSNTSSDFVNNTTSANKAAFHLGNVGAVFHQRYSSANWKAVNFGIGLNRINNFNQKFEYDGVSTGTIANYFIDGAQGFLPNELYAYEDALAYDSGLIYRPYDLGLSDDETYYENDFFPGDMVRKKETVEIKGYMDELTFSGAGNYRHKFYFGAAIGITFLKYEEAKTYEEIDDVENNDADYLGSVPYFNASTFSQNLLSSGFGTNIKLGLIYRINQKYRIGGAIHSPTFLSMNDQFSNDLETDVTYFELDPDSQNERSILTAESEIGNFSYSLNTPWRYFLNGGVLIGKMGFLSAEIEFVDYASSRFKFPDETAFEEEVRNTILTSFRDAVFNARIGTEWRKEDYRFRGGVSFYGNQLVAGTNQKILAHAGLGLRKELYFIDLAFTHKLSTTSDYYPYISPDANQPIISNSEAQSNVLLTFGFKI